MGDGGDAPPAKWRRATRRFKAQPAHRPGGAADGAAGHAGAADGPLFRDVNPPGGRRDPPALHGRARCRCSPSWEDQDGPPGIRDWWARYPFSCLASKDQQGDRHGDTQAWQRTVASLPAYLDADGLAYFAARGETHQGSAATSTAYLLAATHEAAVHQPGFCLPDEAAQCAMEPGRIAFVAGRIQRSHWSPRVGNLGTRVLVAIEALSRYGSGRGPHGEQHHHCAQPVAHALGD